MLRKKDQDALLTYLQKENNDIIAVDFTNADRVQIVIAEAHWDPAIQCQELRTLMGLYKHFSLRLIGKEGYHRVRDEDEWPKLSLNKVARDEKAMAELLPRWNAASLLYTLGDVAYVKLYEFYTDQLTREIDQNLYQLWLKKRKREQTASDDRDFDFWLMRMQTVVLRSRSEQMVKMLFDAQVEHRQNVSIMVCGASHTPLKKEWAPYSIIQTLQTLGLGYVICAPQGVKRYLPRDPWDFYSKEPAYVRKGHEPEKITYEIQEVY